MPIEDHRAVVEQLRSVPTQPTDDENTLDAGTAGRHRADKIVVAVRIPQRTRIDPTPGLLDQ